MKKSIFNIFLGFILIAGMVNISYSLPACTGIATSNECSNSDLNGTSCNYYSTSNATENSDTTCTYYCMTACDCSCGKSDCPETSGVTCNTCTTVTSTTYIGTQCGAGGTSGTCEGSGSCEYTVG